MQTPIRLPSAALLTGGGLTPKRLFDRRLESAEDRYMALYGKKDWTSSNMDLCIHVGSGLKGLLADAFLKRLDAHLASGSPESTRLWREEADFSRSAVLFREHSKLRAEDTTTPRRGLYVDLSGPDRIRVVWNHMQTDGVGMWNALRPLFDENPPLIPYGDIPAPPPLLPELLALPSVARRLVWRGRLRGRTPAGAELTRGLARWDAHRIRQLKREAGGSFNLVSSAMTVLEVFRRHLDRDTITVGLTAYFPFLKGRNKYGVFLCKVRRGDLRSIVAQLKKQTRSQMLNWGRSSAQAFALRQLPDTAFAHLINYYRRQVDVLVSSLPVGRRPITLAGIPTVISCHPWELTLPYYFLLVGTRRELHVSFTSRFRQDSRFLDVAPFAAEAATAAPRLPFAPSSTQTRPPSHGSLAN